MTLIKKTIKDIAKRGLAADLGLDLFRLGSLATLCMGASLMLNQLRETPLSLVYASQHARLQDAVGHLTREVEAAPKPEALSSAESLVHESNAAQTIVLAEFQTLVASKQALVLDARPEIFYRFGHVPKALSLSREKFEHDYAERRQSLASKVNHPIIVYCSSASCEDSQMVADALVKLGYRHILVYKGGWDEWIQTGGEEEKS